MDCNCKIMEMQLEEIKKQLAKEKENCKKTAKQLEEVKTELDKKDKRKGLELLILPLMSVLRQRSVVWKRLLMRLTRRSAASNRR